MNRLIRVNMTDKKIAIENYPELAALGGRQLCAKILNEEIDPLCEPLGYKNKLVFAPGTLAGTNASSASRISVGAKSPLTMGIKEANSGGTAGSLLARCGIKAIILEGKAGDEVPWVLKIKGDEVSLFSDNSLRFMGTYETVKKLRDAHGLRCAVLCIGPAGERKLRGAGIAIVDPGGNLKFAARGGLGAVMGSKGLKAIVVDDAGTNQLTYADRSNFLNLAKSLNKQLMDDPKTKNIYHRYGTSGIVKAVNAMGAFPVRNFRFGSMENIDSLSGEKLNELVTRRGGDGRFGIPCMAGCVIKCSHCFPDENGKEIVSTLQYETIALVGANLCMESLDSVARLNWEINDLGLDTIETGAALGVALDQGLGKFGSEQDCMALLKEIRKDSPLGRIIGNGVRITGEVLGSDRIPAAKGQAFPGYDPRALKGNGVTYAMSPMGADHTAGNCFGARNEVNPLGTDKQGELSRTLQIKMATLDSLGFCIFARVPLFADPELLAGLVNSLTGTNYNPESVWDIGIQTLKMEREFNIKAGVSPFNDRLPEFVYSEPLAPTQAVFDLSQEEMERALV